MRVVDEPPDAVAECLHLTPLLAWEKCDANQPVDAVKVRHELVGRISPDARWPRVRRIERSRQRFRDLAIRRRWGRSKVAEFRRWSLFLTKNIWCFQRDHQPRETEHDKKGEVEKSQVHVDAANPKRHHGLLPSLFEQRFQRSI